MLTKAALKYNSKKCAILLQFKITILYFNIQFIIVMTMFSLQCHVILQKSF